MIFFTFLFFHGEDLDQDPSGLYRILYKILQGPRESPVLCKILQDPTQGFHIEWQILPKNIEGMNQVTGIL
jgi:hypothetical protein